MEGGWYFLCFFCIFHPKKNEMGHRVGCWVFRIFGWSCTSLLAKSFFFLCVSCFQMLAPKYKNRFKLRLWAAASEHSFNSSGISFCVCGVLPFLYIVFAIVVFVIVVLAPGEGSASTTAQRWQPPLRNIATFNILLGPLSLSFFLPLSQRLWLFFRADLEPCIVNYVGSEWWSGGSGFHILWY